MSTKTDSILLTGSSGFLGTTLAEVLTEQGYFVNTLTKSGANQRVDITEPFDLAMPQQPSIVIHAAGKAHSIPKTEDDKKEFYRVNFHGTKNLCSALEQLDELPKCFVFISTVALYGVEEGEFIAETHKLNGTTPYAESKIIAEDWLRHWAKKCGIKIGILRLPLIVGPNPPGNLGAMIMGIKSGKYLSIGNADARKSLVWAEDVAQIIPALAKKGGTFNLTDGIHPTFGELEEAISSTLNRRKPIKIPYWVAKGLAKIGDHLGSRFLINSDKLAKITSTLTFDDQKARQNLGWSPTSVLSKIGKII